MVGPVAWKSVPMKINIMKKVFISFLLSLFGTSGICQSTESLISTELENYLRDLEKEITTAKGTQLMTYPALNVLMANKANTYLAGIGDLSINKSYFIIDPADGRLFLGFNTAKNPSETGKRNQSILTTGIKANVSDAFSTIYDGENRKFSGDIGASIKFTILGRGSLTFNDGQVQEQKLLTPGRTQSELTKLYRQEIYNALCLEIEKDANDFDKRMTNLGDQVKDADYRQNSKDEFVEKAQKKYKARYLELEADKVADEFVFKSLRTHWFSFDFYIPITQPSFVVGPDLSTTVQEKSLYNFSATALGTILYERNKTRWLGTASVGALMANNINTEKMKSYTPDKYESEGGSDAAGVSEFGAEKVYIGDYEDFLNPFVRLQGVSFFIAKKRIGLSVLVEKYLGSFDPLNLKIGMPFTLSDQEGKTKVNFELQCKWNDLDNSIYPGKSAHEKFVFGLSVGVPLISNIY